ncbi:alpha/beta hydrolase, partial [Actinotalea sp. M2MS4P-6]|uniref:alpha/beta fold hydrolase n=1 Tax=Actinotalea sp. M2MS4P-6 TaxID=2983762 RepID=UPI0021E47B42
MTISLGASGELAALASAIGLLDEHGELDLDWFSAPLAKLEGMLRTPSQRAALGEFFDLALPPEPQPGRPAAEKWHPLLGDLDRGNLYLTLADTGAGLTLGLAGDFHTEAGAAVPASLRVQADVVAANGAVDLVIGTAAHPIAVELRVQTDWTYDPGAGRPVGLRAVVGRFTIVPDPSNPGVSMQVVLEQLSLGGETPVDTVMDVEDLGRNAPDLIAGLLKIALAEAGPDPVLTRLADHVLALFGLADADAIPAFPFAEIADGPAAVQSWLAQLVGATGAPTAAPWLEHLAGLLGTDVAATGSGTADLPWRVPLVDLGGGEVVATLALVDGHLRVGLGVDVGGSLGGGQPDLHVEAQVALADVPLDGAAPPVVLPRATALLVLDGPGAAALVDSATVKVGSLRTGLAWDGTTLAPTLELLDNRLGATPYDRLDLTNVDSVEAAATGLVVDAITQALGSDVGRRLAAIVGLVAPEDPANPGAALPGWTHHLDLTRLVVDPAGAIGDYHRAVLTDADSWTHLLREIGLLVGLPGAIAGTGTSADPWTVTIAGAGGPELQLAAWHQVAPADATVHQLRLGLRLAATPGGASLSLSGEVLSIDLPASGSATVGFLGAQQLRLVLHPAVDTQLGAVAVSLDTLDAAAGWQPGGSFGWQVRAQGLTLAVDGDSVTVDELHLPPTAAFDLTDLPTSAAALGLDVADLVGTLRMVLVLLAEQAGAEVELGAALLGLHVHLPGLSEDAPLIVDPADPGLLLRDPAGALRSWLARLVAHVGTAGEAGLTALLRTVASLGTELLGELTGQVAGLAEDTIGAAELELAGLLGGTGSFPDPWRLPWPGGGGTTGADGPDLEVWLEPQGPPTGWLGGLRTRAQEATSPEELAAVLRETAWFDPDLRSLLRGLGLDDLLQRLVYLEVHLAAGDGVVPRDSQLPDVFGWAHGIEADAAHHLLPTHPDVIAEVAARVEELHGAGPRTVLLVGPDFADHTVWADLLAAPALQGTTDPAAHVDLRTPGIDPRTIALDGLTAVADYYTVDLGAGDLAHQAAQVAHVADRLAVLHPGPIVVVAHSTAGLVARQFAADHTDRVAGLVTIGAPHLGAPLPFLREPELGDAVRIAGVLLPQMAASPLRDALTHLLGAVEGYVPAPAPGALDVARPYPEQAFSVTAPFDLGDVPVVTIAGGLAGDLLAELGAALADHIQALTAVARPDPTHLSYGMSMPIALPGAADGPAGLARVRFGLGQIALGGAAAPRPAELLRVELDLARDGGWLVGGPGLSDVDGRLRRLQLGVTAVAGPSGTQATLDATLDQAAWRGTTAAHVDLDDPRAAALLGAAFGAALAGSPTTGPVSGLADALTAIGLVATDVAGVTSLAADAFATLRTDPVGYLGTRIPPALARPDGWAGLTGGGTDGGFRHAAAGTPYDLFVRQEGSTWRTGIETTTAPEAPLWVSADVDLVLPAFTPTVEVGAHLGVATLRYRSDGTLTLDVDPFLTDVPLLPTPSLAELGAHLEAALPDILATGVVGTVLAQVVPGLDLAALGRLLHAPGEMLADVLAGADGFDPTAVGGILTALNTAIGLPAGPGLQLPGDVSLTAAAGAAPGSVALGVQTTAPIGGVLGLGFALDIDRTRHVTPSGTVTVDTPLTGTWPQVSIEFGASIAGATLVVTPQGVAPITLLPTFSGLGALRGAGAALLPQVLDAAVAELTPHPAWLDHVLAAAGHLDLYDAAGKFSAHTATFAAMLDGTWFDGVAAGARTGVAQAVVDLLGLVPGVPGAFDAPATGLVRWTLALPAGAGDLQVSAGWGLAGPTAELAITDLHPAGAPVSLSAGTRIDPTGVDVSTSLGADFGSLGIDLVPRFELALVDGELTARFLPLAGTGDGPLVVTLAPEVSVDVGAGTAEELVVGWALPLAVQVALVAADPVLNHPLWTGGPTLEDALTDAGLLVGGNVAHPLPGVFEMLAAFLAAASDALDLTLGELHLSLVAESGRVGLGLSGTQAIPLGDLELDVLFGAPTSWGAPAAEGLQVLLLDISGSEPAFDLGIQLHGVGVGLSKADGTALVSETALRLGGVKAFLFLDLETGTGSLVASHGGAGLELSGFGLPLSAALGGGGGSNPVASNLLSSGGSGGAGGDDQSVNPVTDVDVWYWDDAGASSATLHVLVGGQDGLFWIPIHAGFGPIFIDELGVGVSSTTLTLAIDGGVSVAGLTAEVDELSVAVPYASVTDPSTWVIDLKGLAVGYSGPAISIAGGLVKFDGPPIEYDGMLLVKIGTIGAIVIGSYAVVGEGADEYTSFAVFGGVFVPIGLPPIINLTGIALGMGYNRRLVVPEDLNTIPDFMLVKALDRPEDLANDPMKALYSFRDQVPPSRGALWFAAGLRGTSFEIVNITAVVYVALDNGVEVGLLGVARMALPTDDAAIVSVELALKARFSSAEGLFSVQAQLTDNSWLISKDCRLTGGFAFFVWFRESQFLLTLGGYHPAFQPRPEYPVVPRIGFEWNFLGVVHLKGESYFALTTTAIMTGTRVEATYGPDWIQVWFSAYTDILVMRDPFHYIVDIGISVGARLRIRVCFFACATIEISVSVGASLHLEGPPFHGTVTADLGVTSVTVPFGDNALPEPPMRHWDEFVEMFVKAGDANAGSVAAQVTTGLLPAEPAGAPVAPGTAEQPWRVSAEWSLRTESKMPARGFALQVDTAMTEAQIGSVVFGRVASLSTVYDFDLAPMGVPHDHLTTVHRVVLARRPEGGGAFVDMVPAGGAAPADLALVLDPVLFKVAPVIAQVSEATYHSFPHLKPPAAANTLPVLAGLTLDGTPQLVRPSERIPIGTLVDASNFRPLPFAKRTPVFIGHVRDLGAAWQTLAGLADGVDDRRLVAGVLQILGRPADPEGPAVQFAELRAASGLRPGGYGPVAMGALANRRSAPPVLSALSEGFTLEDPGRGTAEEPVPIPAVEGVALDRPRLQSVLQRPVPAVGATPAVVTSVRARRPLPTRGLVPAG